MADQLWLMTRMREEEEDLMLRLHLLDLSYSVLYNKSYKWSLSLSVHLCWELFCSNTSYLFYVLSGMLNMPPLASLDFGG